MKQVINLNNFAAGAQTTGTGKRSWTIPRGNWRLRDVRARLETAPVGSTFLIDVNKNGTTIYTAQGDRTTFADGANAANAHRTQAGTGSFVGGDRLSYDIDQIGSGTAGSDLSTSFQLERA